MTKDYDEQDGSDYGFAESNGPMDYEAFRQTYRVPEWKDTKGRVKRQPPRNLGGARHTNKEVYWSKDVHQQEWEKIWSKTWLFAGHLTDIPRPNCFMKIDRGPESVLVVRGEGDTVHAMYNVCQHRGNRLVTSDFGSTKKFVCPFHKWEFDADGSNIKVSDRETFRKESLCHNLDLPPVNVAVWRGWVFINFDDDAPPLEQFLGKDFIEAAALYDFEEALRIRDVQQTWPANWKTAHEAFVEGYHVQGIHPQLVPAVDSYHAPVDLFENGHGLSVYQFMSPAPQYVEELPEGLCEEHKIFLREANIPEDKWPKHWSGVPQALIEAKLNRTDYVIDYSKFSEGQLVDDWNMGIFPTSEMFLHPEGFFIQHWWPHPTDPEKCIYNVSVYAVPGISELPSFMGVEDGDLSGKKVLPRSHTDTDDYESLGPVIAQDRVLVPLVQAGLHSKGFVGAIYSEQEMRIRHFFDEYYRYLNGQKEWAEVSE